MLSYVHTYVRYFTYLTVSINVHTCLCFLLHLTFIVFLLSSLLPSSPSLDSAKQEADTNICAHLLQVQSYRGPTFCDHCGRIMGGITKQGLKCEGGLQHNDLHSGAS